MEENNNPFQTPTEPEQPVFEDMRLENALSEPIVKPADVQTGNDADHENVLAGLVGAFLFALVGGVVWFVLNMVGYIAGISGLIAVVCATKGYAKFAKKESLQGVILSAVMALIVIILAWYFSFGYDIYCVYQDWYAEGSVDFTLTFSESVRTVPLFLEEPEVALEYLKNLGLGLLFCLIACGYYLSAKVRTIKANKSGN